MSGSQSSSPTSGTVGRTRSSSTPYTLGRLDFETQRLIQQHALYGDSTRRLFIEAGIGPGQRVLDLGSGAGDVALLAGELVGPTGSVVGVDLNPSVLEIARTRARDRGLGHVTFVQGDVAELSLAPEFDAIVGRLVLMYLPDPESTLRTLVNLLRPDGVAVFQEMDFSVCSALAASGVGTPLILRIVPWMLEVFRRSGARTEMGRDLVATFRAAGLSVPALSLYAPMGASADWSGYQYISDTFRSVLPLMERYGIATAAEVDVDTLAERLVAEAIATNQPFFLSPMISGWARKPET